MIKKGYLYWNNVDLNRTPTHKYHEYLNDQGVGPAKTGSYT